MSCRPLTLLSCIFVLHGCAPLGDTISPIESACAVTIAHAADFKHDEKRPIAVHTRAPLDGPTLQEVDANLGETPQPEKNPDTLLLRGAAETRDVSVVSRCPALKTWLVENEVVHSDSEIEKLIRKEPWPVSVLAMSLPFVSDDGSTAAFYASEYSGRMGGGTDLVIYRKKGVAWVYERRLPLSIS